MNERCRVHSDRLPCRTFPLEQGRCPCGSSVPILSLKTVHQPPAPELSSLTLAATSRPPGLWNTAADRQQDSSDVAPVFQKKVSFLQVRKMPGASGTQVREPQPTVPWLQERLLGALRSAGFAPGCAQIQDSPDETRLAEDQLSGSRLTQFPGPFSQRPAVPCCTGSCLTMG